MLDDGQSEAGSRLGTGDAVREYLLPFPGRHTGAVVTDCEPFGGGIDAYRHACVLPTHIVVGLRSTTPVVGPLSAAFATVFDTVPEHVLEQLQELVAVASDLPVAVDLQRRIAGVDVAPGRLRQRREL